MADALAAAQLNALADEPVCKLETMGRISGERRIVELWFAIHSDTLYFLSGARDGADWVRNLRRQPRVRVNIVDAAFAGLARIVEDPEEDRRARELLAAKYQGWERGRALSRWAATSLPVAVDIGP